jgi:L-ascorbate metabolism protein UlaG (beta-lactamase superfamily)
MGPTAALEAVKLVKPRLVIPIHYDTFPLLKQDAQAFKLAVEESTSTSCLVLAPGEEVTL